MVNKSASIIILCLFTWGTILGSHAADFSYYALNTEPAGYKDEGQTKGYYVDILSRVGEELGQVDVKVTIAPYSRIAHSLNENTSGFVLTCLFKNDKLKENVHQTFEAVRFKTGIVSLSTSPLTWENSKGKVIATVHGASRVYGSKFHDKIKAGDIDLRPATDYKNGIRMLVAGRIDAFAGNLAPILHYAGSESADFAQPAIITEKISYLTVSVAPGTPNSAAILAKIGQIIEKMRASGEIKSIVASYVSDSAYHGN